jgi:hypothetical protein
MLLLRNYRAVALTTMFAVFLFGFTLPTMREKLLHIGFAQIGSGARISLMQQFWVCPLSLFGYGFEQQIYLINPFSPGFEMALYDRFHCWPLDVAISTGWAGIAICLTAVFLIFKFVWKHRKNDRVLSLAAGLLAFLIAALFNPPTMQSMMVATLVTSGIIYYSCDFVETPHWYAILGSVLTVLCGVIFVVGMVCLTHDVVEFGPSTSEGFPYASKNVVEKHGIFK